MQKITLFAILLGLTRAAPPLKTRAFEHEYELLPEVKPVNQISSLLQFLRNQVEVALGAKKAEAEKFKIWCAAAKKQKEEKEIFLKAKQDKLTANIASSALTIAEYDKQLAAFEADKSNAETDLATQEELIEKNSKRYQIERQEYDAAIEAMKVVVDIVTKKKGSLQVKQSFLQLQTNRLVAGKLSASSLETLKQMQPEAADVAASLTAPEVGSPNFAYLHNLQDSALGSLYDNLLRIIQEIETDAASKKAEMMTSQRAAEASMQESQNIISESIVRIRQTTTLKKGESSMKSKLEFWKMGMDAELAAVQTYIADLRSEESNVGNGFFGGLCVEQNSYYAQAIADMNTEIAAIAKAITLVDDLVAKAPAYFSMFRGGGVPQWAINGAYAVGNNGGYGVDNLGNDDASRTNSYYGKHDYTGDQVGDANVKNKYKRHTATDTQGAASKKMDGPAVSSFAQLRSLLNKRDGLPKYDQAIAYLQMQSKKLGSSLLANLVAQQHAAPYGYVDGNEQKMRSVDWSTDNVQWDKDATKDEFSGNPSQSPDFAGNSFYYDASKRFVNVKGAYKPTMDSQMKDPFLELRRTIYALIHQMETEGFKDKEVNEACGAKKTELVNKKGQVEAAIAAAKTQFAADEAELPVHEYDLEKMNILKSEYTAEKKTLDEQKAKIQAEKTQVIKDTTAIALAATRAVEVLDDFQLDLDIYEDKSDNAVKDEMEDTLKTKVDLAEGGGATGDNTKLSSSNAREMVLPSGVQDDLKAETGLPRYQKVDGTLVDYGAQSGKKPRDGALVKGALQPYLRQVITMIKMVATDAEKTRDDAEAEWTAFATNHNKAETDLNNVMTRLTEDIATKKDAITNLKSSMAHEKATQTAKETELADTVQKYDANEEKCDMAGKMHERHEKIKSEIQALKEANAILAGSTIVGS